MPGRKETLTDDHNTLLLRCTSARSRALRRTATCRRRNGNARLRPPGTYATQSIAAIDKIYGAETTWTPSANKQSANKKQSPAEEDAIREKNQDAHARYKSRIREINEKNYEPVRGGRSGGGGRGSDNSERQRQIREARKTRDASITALDRSDSDSDKDIGYYDLPTPQAGRQDSGGGGCFLTTAVVRRRGESEDGPTLTALRAFRDTYMQETPDETRRGRAVPPRGSHARRCDWR